MEREVHLRAGLEASRVASEILLHHFRSETLVIDDKVDGTPVTQADREAEMAIREVLSRRTPDVGLLGEELPAEGPRDARWIIDPLDGTKNFVSGLPLFAVLLSLEIEGRVELGIVHAPSSGKTWWAARGVGAFSCRGTDPERCRDRILSVGDVSRVNEAFICHGGLSHIEELGLWDPFTTLVRESRRTRGFGDYWGHMLVAEGRVDAMIDPRVALHDVAGVGLIVEEAGGQLVSRHDVSIDERFCGLVLSANSDLLVQLRQVLSV